MECGLRDEDVGRGIWDVGYKVLNVEYGMGKERCKAWDMECRMRGMGHGIMRHRMQTVGYGT